MSDPEAITRVAEVERTLQQIGNIVKPDFSEDEVQMLFLNEGYFNLLGFSEIGTELRSEVSAGSRRADYVTTGRELEGYSPSVSVYEFKNPKRSLQKHQDQLEECMNALHAEYGVLTNGVEFHLYELNHGNMKPHFQKQLTEVQGGAAGIIVSCLGYLSLKEQELRTIAEGTAEAVTEELPENLWKHPALTEATVDAFADHHAEFLLKRIQQRRNSDSD